MKSKAIYAFYFVVLEILWIFRLFYDAIVPSDKCRVKKSDVDATSSWTQSRHLIQLYTMDAEKRDRRPVCYMHVSELISPQEEEMLRCACAKGTPHPATYPKQRRGSPLRPPKNEISRRKFTDQWMESLSSLVVQ